MKSFFKRLVVVTLLLGMGCDKPNDLLSALSDVFFTDFSNGWTVIKGANTNSIFFINSTITDSSKGIGTLEAQEEDGFDNFKLKGTFENLKVKLNYLTEAENNGDDNGPHAGFSYSGKVDTFVKPILIRLVNVNDSNDSLVIKHG